jgi:hypothetical protein
LCNTVFNPNLFISLVAMSTVRSIDEPRHRPNERSPDGMPPVCRHVPAPETRPEPKEQIT